jgi:fatty acid desaturase
MTERKPKAITWYRTPLSPEDLKSLCRKSDLLGSLQTGGFLLVYLATLSLALISFYRWHWTATVALTFLHGTVAAFMINAVHELTHGTVFRTKSLNSFFAKLFGFLDWIDPEMFQTSHARHHRYTLHQPDDLEVVLPIRLMVRDFLATGFIDYRGVRTFARDTIRAAFRRKLPNEWLESLYPPSDPQKRLRPVRWARLTLLGHGLLLALSLYFGIWILPILVSFTALYGRWLFWLCNNTQHIGLQDDVSDFRLCCRTFLLNPVVQFLYWHMNYHVEHHMYAAVPCYRLGRLHRLIRHDLPPCTRGIVATWREIWAIERIQETDPSYQHVPPLPTPAGH